MGMIKDYAQAYELASQVDLVYFFKTILYYEVTYQVDVENTKKYLNCQNIHYEICLPGLSLECVLF